MAESTRDRMLVVACEAELPPTDRVWGTGGWLPPEQREALDWLTFARLMGWGVHVSRRTQSGLETGLSGGSCWIILACDPDDLGEELVALLATRLETEALLVVARAGVRGGTFARLAGAVHRSASITGQAVRWNGPGPERAWRCRKALDASALELSATVKTWVTLDGAPLIVARQVGRGMVATLGFHPSRARDADGVATAVLKHLLVWGAAVPIAWLDLEGSMILRMDDPGSAENVYHRGYVYRKLGEANWAAIAADLRRRNARMSVGYVAGWVDDGDITRGVMKVAGRVPPRVLGQVYPSPLVQYQDLTGDAPGTLHDYEAEFRGIQALRAAGLGDVEFHGYTHMHPDSASWATAPDRYTATSWYRELGKAAQEVIMSRPADKHPLALGIVAFHQYFDVHPTTLICPGDQWTTPDVPERALDLGLQLIGSYYLAIRDGTRFCWTQHVCAPYLTEPDAAWFDAGLPVVGYFHDRDLALEGVEWMSRWLDQWQKAGAKRLMDFRELTAAIGRHVFLEEDDDALRLIVTGESAPALVRPLPVTLRVPGRRLPAYVSVLLHDRVLSLPIYPLGDGLGRVILPCSSPSA